MNHLVVNEPAPDSASRKLDSMVAGTEKPYGYLGEGPPADSGDYDMKSRQERTSGKRK